MARTTKTGLDYFPFDVDFFEDEKLQFLSVKFGITGEVVAIKLLCRIYRNGYYMKWGEDEAALFAKRVGVGIPPSLISEIVEELADRNFFDRAIYENHGVLTSRGIQKRYLEATRRRKNPSVYTMYTLIPINADINPINVNINPLNVDIGTQSKGKERRVKESESKVHPPPTLAQVESYFLEIKKPINWSQKFFDHYSMNNWKTKNGEAITDWKAAIRNWCNKENEFIKNGNAPSYLSAPTHTDLKWKNDIKQAEDEIKKHGKFKGFTDNTTSDDLEALPIN